MPIELIIPGILAVLAVVTIYKGLCIVQQSQTVIIERLGRYYRTLSSGVNIIIPFIDRPRPMRWRYTIPGPNGQTFVRFTEITNIDLRETVYDFPRQSVITKDNVVTEINAILYFQIVDPMRAMYEIQNLPDAIEKLTQTSLRNIIGEMDLDETLTSRDTINNKLRIILDEATAYADVENEAKIQEALSRLMKDKTLIVVAHRLNTIVGADQIMVLDRGKIDNIGTHQELIQNSSVYQKLWQSYSGKEVAE